MRSTRLVVATVLVSFLFTAAAPAATYPPSYRWRTITTEHFYIHYHTGLDDIARRTSVMAEEIHDRVVPLMEWTPEQRTHVVLSDNVDVSNGSASFFPNNRIEIYVSAPGADPSSPLEFYDNWLNLVLTHEYVHILHLDQAFGLAGLFRRLFGRTPLSFPNAYSPLWMTEGIATLIESEATDAGRLKGTYVDMILRTSAVEKAWFKEPQASGITPAWPGGAARYFYGAKFLQYVAQTEGMDRLAAFFHEYAASPVPFRVEATALATIGTTFSQMYEAWSELAQREYLGEYRKLVDEGLTRRDQLTRLGYETKYTVVSPDGRFVAYGHRGPFEEATIRVFDVQRGREVETKQVNTISHLGWSPDSRQLAYSMLEFKNSTAIISDLYIWNVGSARSRQITSGKRLKDPAFSADGRSLIAVENRGGRNKLVEVDLESGAIRPLVTPDDFTQFSTPTVSRDGSRIAVAEWKEGRVDIVLYNRDGGRIANLTESLPRSTNASPRFTPDDRTVIFTSDVTGVSNVFSVSVDARDIRRLSNLYGGAFYPSTADGRTIYYSDYSARGFDLARMTTGQTYAITDRIEPKTLIARSEEVEGRESEEIPEYARPLQTTDAPRSEFRPTEAPYRVWRSLRPQWWFPILSSSEYETIIGAQTSGSDVLGWHQYQAQFIASFAEDQNQYDYALIYSYDRLYPTFTAAALQFDESITELVFPGPEFDYFYRETLQRTVGLMTLPFRRFNWQTQATAGVIRDEYTEHLPFDVTTEELASVGLFQGTLQGIRAGLAFNSANRFGYSVSPEDGILATIDYEDLSEAFGSEADRRQLSADVRGFLSIPFRRSPLGRHVLGLRAAAGTSEGDFIFQREFRVGGSDVGGLLRLDTTRLPVRGFSSSTLRGQNAALGSIEYRFPIYEIERGPAVYPIFFQRIIGDIFYDTATAWNDDPVNLPLVQRPTSDPFDPGRTLSSAGAEIALDMFFGYFVPIRYRLGAAYILESPDAEDEGSFQGYLTAGTSF